MHEDDVAGARRQLHCVRLGIAVLVFAPSILEAIAALPCFLAERPGALCGLGVILVIEASIPIVLIAAFGFIAASRLRPIRIAGAVLTVTLLGLAAAAQALLAPTEPRDCDKLPEITKRSSCLNAFAGRSHCARAAVPCTVRRERRDDEADASPQISRTARASTAGWPTPTGSAAVGSRRHGRTCAR